MAFREPLRIPYDGFMHRMVRLPRNILEGISRALGHGSPARNPQFPQTPPWQEQLPTIPEEWLFLNLFEEQYGSRHPFCYACCFIEALKIAKDESKFVFVYLHEPENPYTEAFCRNTLCSQLAVEFLDANFVSWGAVASRGEGSEMATTLRVTSFPFCAVVAPDSGKTIAVMHQIEGPVSPQELVEILQRTIEEQGLAFWASRKAEEETLRENRRLREEQDAAYIESLQKDKEKERAHEVAVKYGIRPSAETGRNGNEERPRKIPAIKLSSVKQKEVSKETQRKDKTTSSKTQPFTKILIRFPNGERQEKSFLNMDTIRSIYKYIDSLDIPAIGGYQVIYSFPRKVYGHENLETTLKDAGLHPNAALFLELL